MIKRGKVVKLLGGFYYVQTDDGHIEETRARGVLRHQNIKPLVGDNVIYTFAEGENLSYVEEVLPRKNHLLRPPVANVDQVLLFIPVRSPKYNLYLIDKLIAYYESLKIEIIITISKSDLNESDSMRLCKIYSHSNFKVFLISEYNDFNFSQLKEQLENKTTALSGVSGAGKSTFTNRLLNKEIQTQSVSKKTDRGRHTTRHTELLSGENGIFLFDTPGFSNLDINEISSEDLDSYFRDFLPYKDTCQFQDCSHLNEPNCQVIHAYKSKLIEQSRYENYIKIYDEIYKKEKEKWR